MSKENFKEQNMFGVYMTRNLNSFSSFEQYSLPASFRKEFEKKCATHDTV